MPPSNFTSRHRLNSPEQFKKFFEGAEVFRLGSCVVFRIPNALNHYRLGITLKAPGARNVDRNRVRRVVREFFRTHPRELGSFDYNVVISRAKTIGYPFPNTLRKALEGALPLWSVRS